MLLDLAEKADCRDFRFSSIAVLTDASVPSRRDTGNLRCALMSAIGDYKGGAVSFDVPQTDGSILSQAWSHKDPATKTRPRPLKQKLEP